MNYLEAFHHKNKPQPFRETVICFQCFRWNKKQALVQALKSAVMCDMSCDVCVSHFVSMICSSSWAFLHSSSAGGKLFPTLVKSAAILLLRRKPAARRFSP